MKTKINLQQASKITKIDPTVLAKMIQQNKLPFGIAIPCKKYFSYIIYKEDVLAFMGE